MLERITKLAQGGTGGLPFNISPQNQGFMGGGGTQLVNNLTNTIDTVSEVALLICVAGFILGAALYAFTARQGHTRSHDATRLILGSLIGVLLFGGMSAIMSIAFNAGGAL